MIAIAYRTFSAKDINKRLQGYVGDRDLNHEDRKDFASQKDVQGSLFNRTVISALKRIIVFVGRLSPRYSLAKVDRQLSIIHNPLNLKAREFFGLRIVLLIIGFLLAVLINIRSFPFTLKLLSTGNPISQLVANFNSPAIMPIYFGIVIILILFLFPSIWLNLQVRQTKEVIQKELADALDMLSVCTDAGLGFDQALQRVAGLSQTNIGFEFQRVVSEMEVGIPRAAALRNMSEKLNILELSAFVAIIIQSDTLGMRITDVLHSQAEQMRILRQFRAKEIAGQLPAKMIIPLALFIFPAIIAVILAPLIPKFMSLFE